MIDAELAHLQLRPADTPCPAPSAADGPVEVWEGNDGLEAYGYTAQDHGWIQLPGVATFRVGEAGTVIAVPDRDGNEEIVRDAYVRNVLPLVLQLRGIEVLHASAVETPSGVVALAGRSGSGKSTLAYGLASRGFPPWADDAVTLHAGPQSVFSARVPFSLRVHQDASQTFPAPPLIPTDNHASLRVHAIVVLDPSGEPGAARIERPTLREALTMLLPHAYYYRLSDATRMQRMLDHYLGLVSIVRIHELRFRHDFAELPSVLDVLESHVIAA